MEALVNTVSSSLGFAFQPLALGLVLLGTAFGILLGALPGITGVTGMAIVLPFTYNMAPEYGIVLMVSILVGSQFGNSIPAILIRTPGTPAAVLVVVEGFKFQQRGEGGRALGLSLVSSTIGQILSILAFIALVVPLSRMAVKILFPEIFALVLLGLVSAASLTGKSPTKGIIACSFGVILATIGPDPVTSQPRFDFGLLQLRVGLDIIPVLIGLLAFGEVFRASRQVISWEKVGGKLGAAMPTLADMRLAALPIGLGTVIGVFIGALPGAGGTIASFISYNQARLLSRHRDQFGKGSVEGLTAADSANNAAVGGELIPTLGLGIPGAAGMVVILGALMIQGIQPGPLLLQNRPQLLDATFGGLLTATAAMFILGLLLIRPSARISTIARPTVIMATFVLVVVGVYAINWSVDDVMVAVGLGFIGYLMTRYGYPTAPAVLGFILGNLLEANLRRGLIMTDGFEGFLARPGTSAFLALAVFTAVLPFILERWRRRSEPGGVEGKVEETLAT